MSERKANYLDYAFGGQIVVANGIKDTFGEAVPPPYDAVVRGVGTLVGSLYRMDEVIARSFQDSNSLQDRTMSYRSVRKTFTGMDTDARRVYSNAVTCGNPPKRFIEWKGDDSWADWLAKKPNRGGPTRKQVYELLEWNAGDMIALNRQHKEELDAIATDYVNVAQQGADKGRLSQFFVDRAAQQLSNADFVIVDLFNPQNSGGAAHRKGSVSFIERSASSELLIHESTHLVGGFQGLFLDEVATDMITHEMNPGVTPSHDMTMYTMTERLIAPVLESAGITTAELSELYAGPNPKYNRKRLHLLVRQRTGSNLLEEREESFNKRKRFWMTRTIFNQELSLIYATLELLKEVEPDMSYQELLRRDVSLIVPDEDVARMTDTMESLLAKSRPQVVKDLFVHGAL